MSLLVSTDLAAAHLSDPDWVFLDCRHDLFDRGYGRMRYAEGHIPGAHFLDLEHELAAPKTGANGRHPLPDAGTLARVFAGKGIDTHSHVVLYDDAGHNYSVRGWWSLHWLGHQHVHLLDGGYPKWLGEGRATSQTIPAPHATDWQGAPDLAGTVDLAFMTEQHRSASVLVIDARTAERYRGEQEPIDPVAGHIPGAVNRWFKHNLKDDGTFKAVGDLQREWAALLGDRKPAQVIHQCGSGVTACHNLFAMELAGFPGSRLYPGSWSEWCSDSTRPVACGDA
jgi:thiosulfate/3-mercaptopyruvate sulfurtransferase